MSGRIRLPASLRARARTATFLLLVTGCVGPSPRAAHAIPHDGIHRTAGETFLQTRAYYGVPILQKSLLWDGNGEDDDAGIGVHVENFVADGLALGAGLDAGNWFQSGTDAQSGEIEGLLRWYPLADVPVFWDMHGGYQLATEPVPTGGTDWNFTFGFGPGVDVAIDDGCSLLFGCTYHHTSNALGRDNDRNPSQNEARFWIGFAWTL